MRGMVSKEVSSGGPTSGSKGGKTTMRCEEARIATMAASTHPCTKEDGDHRVVSQAQVSESDVNPCHAVHHSSERESSSTRSSDPQSSGSVKWCKTSNDVEPTAEHDVVSTGEVGRKLSPEFRRLRSMRGLGTQTAQTRGRSNGGVGIFQLGANSSSRLSQCALAESSTDIHLCNDRLKLEVKDA